VVAEMGEINKRPYDIYYQQFADIFPYLRSTLQFVGNKIAIYQEKAGHRNTTYSVGQKITRHSVKTGMYNYDQNAERNFEIIQQYYSAIHLLFVYYDNL
jgi:hypothetical protein